jgi:uncharacterized protein (TIGR02271 family)
MSEQRYVVSADGARGAIIAGTPMAEGQQVRVRFEDGREVLVPASLLELRSDGAYSLPLARAALSSFEAGAGERLVIPVVEEELEVETLQHSHTVRVQKHVRTREETVDVPVQRDEVTVERVPIGRVVETAPQVRSEGDTTVVPVLEEVLVVEKRLMLKEEVRITIQRVAETSQQRVTLRSEEVVVERTADDERALGDIQNQGGA